MSNTINSEQNPQDIDIAAIVISRHWIYIEKSTRRLADAIGSLSDEDLLKLRDKMKEGGYLVLSKQFQEDVKMISQKLSIL